MLASCAPRCLINLQSSLSSRQQARTAQRSAAPPKFVLPGLAAGLFAAQLTLAPAPALALEVGAAEAPPLHTECIARRHARAAAACVATLAGQPPTAVLDGPALQGEGGGEPSKAQIAAERRARLQATAAQLTMTLAGVMDGAAPGADAALKALMGGM
ncbi:hypothetical protein COHA_010490 [Chlorella ohadii]|uniref:Uncharacterized protein n=1 Tax=Chlorella ohadii TaxID=2649997 RepID=A0AAD5DFP4_9CHLO|nr:hypothetical protein COHA_010490 [Chlorella ohadii]